MCVNRSYFLQPTCTVWGECTVANWVVSFELTQCWNHNSRIHGMILGPLDRPTSSCGLRDFEQEQKWAKLHPAFFKKPACRWQMIWNCLSSQIQTVTLSWSVISLEKKENWLISTAQTDQIGPFKPGKSLHSSWGYSSQPTTAWQPKVPPANATIAMSPRENKLDGSGMWIVNKKLVRRPTFATIPRNYGTRLPA